MFKKNSMVLLFAFPVCDGGEFYLHCSWPSWLALVFASREVKTAAKIRHGSIPALDCISFLGAR